MKIAAIGRTQALYNSIEKLNEEGFDIAYVVTCPSEDHYSVDSNDFQKLANRIDASFLHTENINRDEVVKEFREQDLNVAISVNWRTIIKQKIRSTFEHGIINCHAGDLPRYRGNAATNWAIINGEDSIVYTLHFMIDELDAGPILLQKRMPLDEKTRIQDVYNFANTNVPNMFVEVIEQIKNDNVNPKPIDMDNSLRCYPRTPEDSRINWNQSAEQIDRIVRASSEPLFGAYTFYKRKKLRVWRSYPEEAPNEYLGTPGQVAHLRTDKGEVLVLTGENFLVLEEIQLEGTGRKAASEVIQSVRTRLGMDVQSALHKLYKKIDDDQTLQS